MSTIHDLVLAGGSAPSGLLFHATGEPFEGNPRPGAYDGVLWTADCPAIAQTYIPVSGIQSIGSLPLPYEMDRKVMPGRHDFWHAVARSMGHGPADVEYDAVDRLVSWRLPQDWPTYREAGAWLESKGYAFDRNGVVRVSIALGDEHDLILDADHRLQGRLLIASAAGLDLYDASRGESDLTELQYHDLELFRRLEADGYDGVIIDDFLQDEAHGNVGHRSHGLFASSAQRLEWVEIPAARRPWSAGLLSTPEYDDLVSSLSSAPMPP